MTRLGEHFETRLAVIAADLRELGDEMAVAGVNQTTGVVADAIFKRAHALHGAAFRLERWVAKSQAEGGRE